MKITLTLSFLFPIILYSQSCYFNYLYESNSQVWSSEISIMEYDSGYLVGGGTGYIQNDDWHRINLMVLDKNGYKINEVFIGDTIWEYYITHGSLKQTSDGYITLVGNKVKYSNEFPRDKIFIYKLDENYDTSWTQYYGDLIQPFDTSYNVRSFIECSDSSLVIIGTMTPEATYHHQIFLLKTSLSGNIIFRRFYEHPNSTQSLFGYNVIETPDKGFALGAYRYKPGYSYSGEPMVFKVDSLGFEEWSIEIGGPFYDDKTLLCLANEGNIIAATCIADSMSGTENAYRRINFKKIDLNGNVVWDKKYGYSKLYNYIGNIRPTNDGAYIATGSMATVNLPLLLPWESGWIFKLNDNGDSLWFRFQYNLNGSYDDNYLYDIVPTSDNGFVACGEVFGPTTNYLQHAWVIKMDSIGCDEPGCALGTNIFEAPATNTQGLMVWPNPTSGQFSVLSSEFSVGDNKIIRVYDTHGINVYEIEVPAGNATISIEASGWTSGLYYLQYLMDGEIVGSAKIIRN